MKNGRVIVILSILLVFVVACQQTGKTGTRVTTPSATGEAAVDALGKDLGNVAADQSDLSADNLSDVDSGLNDMQNI